VLTSVLVLAGAWINRKNWRFAAIVENIIALLISGAIFSAAFVLVKKSLAAPADQTIRYLPVVLIGTVISASISYLIGQYKLRVGRREDSPSLQADGHHSIMDVYTTAVVAVGLLGYMIGLRLDTIAAIVVVLFVIEVGIEVAVLAVKGLIKQHAFAAGGQNETIRKVGGFFTSLAQKGIQLITGRKTELTSAGFRQWWSLHKRNLILAGLILLAACYLFSGFYTVRPHQTALVTTFGKAAGSLRGPGLHYAPPWPISRVYKIDSNQIQRMEIGFRTLNSGKAKDAQISRASYEWHSLHLSGKYKKEPAEAIMLTGDENLVDLNTVIHYTIADPIAWQFGYADQTDLLRALAENVMRTIVAVTTIDTLLTGSRREIETIAIGKLQKSVDELGLGIRIQGVELQDVHPPVEVVRAFRDVASAKEKKVLAINKAMADQNERIPQARAEAKKLLLESEGYRVAKVFNAEGEGGRFTLLADEYGKAREVTAFRLYVQSMEQALAGKRKFIVSPDLEPGALDLRIFARGQPAAKRTKNPDQTK
jgi:HflK protein